MNNLPSNLHAPISAALLKQGDSTPVRSVSPVSGGCINNAVRLETEKRVYFLKWNDHPLPGLFQSEAGGLSLLARTGTVHVPAVLEACEVENGHPAYILLEWLESSTNSGDSHRLGEQLANLHRSGTSPLTPPAYGLDENNYLGTTYQINTWETDWASFYIKSRLTPQIELAMRNGRMPVQRARQFDQLFQRLPDLLAGVERRPSLIHGDLWGGNVIPSQKGLAIIDPAVSYSDREAEIAYTELFGGFSARFYSAYQSTWPLDPGYPERRDFYNLYHLLNHLNLFGESYGSQIDIILQFYTGKPK